MKRLETKKVIFLSYFLVIFIIIKLPILSFTWLFWGHFLKDLVFWLLGVMLGGYFIKIDQLIYVYFTQPLEPLSLYVKELVNQKRYKEIFQILKDRVREQRLAFRSVIFQAVWVVLALFTISSTVGFFGKSLVMGIGLHLILDEWGELKQGKDISWLFWQVKRPVTLPEQKKFVWIISGIFGILSLLII